MGITGLTPSRYDFNAGPADSLAGINMGLHMISTRRGAPVDEDVADLMRQQLDVVQRLTEDLLDAKRLGSSKTSLDLEDVVLQDVLHAVITQLQGRCAEKSIAVQALAPPVPIGVTGDRVRLQQIFANLIDNAVKYTPPGGHIWVKCTIEEDFAVVHIEDDGRGRGRRIRPVAGRAIEHRRTWKIVQRQV